MRFKNIILEQNKSVKKAKELYDLFRGQEVKNDFETLLYRGYQGEDIDTWKRIKIRKNRKPKDTDNFIDAIIDKMEDVSGLPVPKRRESKFAATTKSEASRYGDVYICFPMESARIASLTNDSFLYFDEAGTILKDFAGDFFKAYKDEDMFSEDPVFRELVISIIKTVETPLANVKAVKRVANNFYDHPGWILSMSQKYYDIYKGAYSMNQLPNAAWSLKNYFDDMKFGVEPPSDEIIFDGEYYIIANVNWFKSNFAWSGTHFVLDR